MKCNKIYLTLISILVFSSCSQYGNEIDRKSQLLDSLKSVYAGKKISINLRSNDAGVVPLTSQYAYVDSERSDLAFKLSGYDEYRIAEEEGFIRVPTQQNPNPKPSDMILIEQINRPDIRGYVHYKYITEFAEVGYYDTK